MAKLGKGRASRVPLPIPAHWSCAEKRQLSLPLHLAVFDERAETAAVSLGKRDDAVGRRADAPFASLTARNQSPAPAAKNPTSIHKRRYENQHMPQRPPMMSEPKVEMGVVSR